MGEEAISKILWSLALGGELTNLGAEATPRDAMVWGLQEQPKSWHTGLTFWVNFYIENVF